VTPRAPLVLGGPGYHWYVVPRVGHPDPETFAGAYRALSEFHDETWERLGLTPEQTVLGGFSMGSVMSYALGLGPDRPAPAGILAFSGFIPTVEGWQPQLPRASRVFIAHGRNDPIIEVSFAERARDLLRASGMDVDYYESYAGHWIEPTHAAAARDWLALTLSQPALLDS
jgi:phospholipase/carboxylesterase